MCAFRKFNIELYFHAFVQLCKIGSIKQQTPLLKKCLKLRIVYAYYDPLLSPYGIRMEICQR